MKYIDIPIDGEKVEVLPSQCGDNTTTVTLDLYQDKSMNLTFTYTKKAVSTEPTDAISDYFLDDVSLDYETTNPYFQNHIGETKLFTLKLRYLKNISLRTTRF